MGTFPLNFLLRLATGPDPCPHHQQNVETQVPPLGRPPKNQKKSGHVSAHYAQSGNNRISAGVPGVGQMLPPLTLLQTHRRVPPRSPLPPGRGGIKGSFPWKDLEARAAPLAKYTDTRNDRHGRGVLRLHKVGAAPPPVPVDFEHAPPPIGMLTQSPTVLPRPWGFSLPRRALWICRFVVDTSQCVFSATAGPLERSRPSVRYLVPQARLERARPCGREILSLVRLPIPPLGLMPRAS